MKPNIMFVDDSISVLESLRWIFKDEPYYLFSFGNPFDALGAINMLEWAVVVVEQLMQQMYGMEFLREIQKYSPHTMGIIMTCYNEVGQTLNMLNPCRVYRFVKKPLDHIEIRQAVKAAINQYELSIGSGKHMNSG